MTRKLKKLGLMVPILALTILTTVVVAYEMEWESPAEGYGTRDYMSKRITVRAVKAVGWKDPQQETVRLTYVKFWAYKDEEVGDVKYEIYVNGVKRSYGTLIPTPGTSGWGTYYSKPVSVTGLNYDSLLTVEVVIWQAEYGTYSWCSAEMEHTLP